MQAGKTVQDKGGVDPTDLLVIAVLITNYLSLPIKATADKEGRWQIMLGPLTVGKPKTMVIETNRGDRVQLDNILVGEVWVCSGQSNMEWPMKKTFGAEKEAAAAKYPKLRLFHVKKATSTKPLKDCTGQWVECTPENVRDFFAVGYYFGRKLLKDLDVPVGLIESAWGGTRVEAWTPRIYLEMNKQAKPLLKWWEARIQKKPKSAGDRHRPANLYNAMISPLVPYGIRGVIWYQGESNRSRAAQYQILFPTMIMSWRRVWDKPELPFGFVQLAPYRYVKSDSKKNLEKDPKIIARDAQQLPELWDAQLTTLKALPAVGMAVTTDVTTLDNIHPRKKKPVGNRLALWALATVYGKKDLVYSGPIYKKMDVEDGQVRIRFDHAAGGLKTSDGKPLTEFTVAGKDQKFYAAEATIDGETVVVHSSKVKHPYFVRFGWTETSTPNLINQKGLPASPFRTDGFKMVTEGKLTP